MMDDLLRYIEVSYERELRRYPELSTELAPHPGVVFGGWVRDRVREYFTGYLYDSADIDYVLVDAHENLRLPSVSMEEAPVDSPHAPRPSALRLDRWRLEDTFTFTRCGFEPSLANLPRTTVFNVNSIWFDPDRRSIRSCGAIDALSSGVLGFQTQAYVWESGELQAYRALAISTRLGLRRTIEVDTFVAAVLSERPLAEVVHAITSRRPTLQRSYVSGLFEGYLAEFPNSARSPICGASARMPRSAHDE